MFDHIRRQCVLLAFRLAFESIVGVLLLFSSWRSLAPSPLMHLTIATLLGVLIGTALVLDALRLRRILNRIDATADVPLE